MRIDLDSVPTTIRVAVYDLLTTLNDDDRAALRQHGDAGAHNSIGRALRNAWSLWERPPSPLLLDAINVYGIGHADDVSGLIVAWVHALACGRSFDPTTHCRRYHEHWQNLGTTALKAAGLDEYEAGK